ncbi:MAG: hypothetical protein P8J59_06915 [Phycisphaerales bacterium]|nr:hypothetical protein [Phycisphaerales bacterium]
MTTDHHQADTGRNTTVQPAAAILWASAFIIATLAIFQAGHLSPNPAFAGMATSTDEGFSLVTSSSGNGPKENPYEFLYVIDSNDESLLIYEIPNANNPTASKLVLIDGAYLPRLFSAGRGG